MFGSFFHDGVPFRSRRKSLDEENQSSAEVNDISAGFESVIRLKLDKKDLTFIYEDHSRNFHDFMCFVKGGEGDKPLMFCLLCYKSMLDQGFNQELICKKIRKQVVTETSARGHLHRVHAEILNNKEDWNQLIKERIKKSAVIFLKRSLF